jgi:hypothetical protein
MPSIAKNHPELKKILQGMINKNLGYIKYKSGTKAYTQNVYDFYDQLGATISNPLTILMSQGLLNGYNPNNVYSFKPEGNEATEEYHAINIFNNMFADWQPKAPEAKGWRTEYADLDAEAIEALVAEVEAYVAPEPEVVAPIAE